MAVFGELVNSTQMRMLCLLIPTSSKDVGWTQVQCLIERGWLKQFESCSELRAFLGKDPLICKFGVVTSYVVRYLEPSNAVNTVLDHSPWAWDAFCCRAEYPLILSLALFKKYITQFNCVLGDSA